MGEQRSNTPKNTGIENFEVKDGDTLVLHRFAEGLYLYNPRTQQHSHLCDADTIENAEIGDWGYGDKEGQNMVTGSFIAAFAAVHEQKQLVASLVGYCNLAGERIVGLVEYYDATHNRLFMAYTTPPLELQSFTGIEHCFYGIDGGFALDDPEELVPRPGFTLNCGLHYVLLYDHHSSAGLMLTVTKVK